MSIEVYTSKDLEYTKSIRKHLDQLFFSISNVLISQNLSPATTHFYNCYDHVSRCSCFQTRSILNHANLCTNWDHNQTCRYFLYSCYYFWQDRASSCSFTEGFKANFKLICSQHRHLYLDIFSYSIFPPLFSSSFKYSPNIFSLLTQSHDQQRHRQPIFIRNLQFLILFYMRETQTNDVLLINSNFFLSMQTHRLYSLLKVFIFSLSFLVTHLFIPHHLIQSLTSLIILSLYFFS